MLRSSTSSSERRGRSGGAWARLSVHFDLRSRPEIGGVPWGLVVCLCILIAVEFGLARRESTWARIPATDVGIVDAIEQRVLTPQRDAGVVPKILFFGNSRTRDAFVPRRLEAQLQLDEGEVLNLALTRGTAYDAELLYRRNRDYLSQAKIAVFGVDVIQLDGSLEANERVRRFAPLRDRLTKFDGAERVDLVAGWIWRSYDARDALRRYAKSLWSEPPREVPIAEDGRVEWRTKNMNRRAGRRRMASYVKQHFEHYARDEKHRERLRAFVELLESDGIEVVIVQVPVRERYAGLSRRKYIEKLGAYEDDVMASVGDRPKLLWWDAETAGLRDVDFHDYGHVKDSGAHRLTRRLGAWIWDRYAPLLRDAPDGPSQG